LQSNYNRLRCVYYLFFASTLVFAQAQPGKITSFADFRPRREMSGQEFAGREVCASCHREKNRSQSATAMAHALSNPKDNSVLQSHPRMTFRTGSYTYEITTESQQSSYRVSDGKETISEPIVYVFGNAHVAQTYVLRRNGKLYEGRVSYYSKIDGLDWTIGDVVNPPPSLEEAFGRDISGDEARNCFSCHGTAAVVDTKLQLERLIPGVTCEACHGPGGTHAAIMQSGIREGQSVLNPKTLDPDTLSQDFCGACHRSANTVGMMPDLGGINNVRFQPYRISGSRGHDSNDPHFACTGCHDPHLDLKQQEASNDVKCTTCHVPHASSPDSTTNSRRASTNKRPVSPPIPRSCPVANAGCESCHMPKVELPGAHFKFTDHRIRIVRDGEPYPF
jgi:hypothetical protein